MVSLSNNNNNNNNEDEDDIQVIRTENLGRGNNDNVKSRLIYTNSQQQQQQQRTVNSSSVPQTIKNIGLLQPPLSSSNTTTTLPTPTPHRNTPRVRCGKCIPCMREDCGKCSYCKKKKKFGGNGKCKNACKERRCINLLDRYPKSSITTSSNHYKPTTKSTTTTTTTATTLSISKDLDPFHVSSLDNNQKKTTMSSSTTKTRIKFKLQQKNASSNNNNKPLLHMYGKPICHSDPLEKCAGCLGQRDEEAKTDPVLLCDGHGCLREYHLRCIVPPILTVPEGDFFCIDCSQKGTALNLLNYFDACDDERESLSHSREYVEMMLHDAMEDSMQLDITNTNAKELDDSQNNNNKDEDSKKRKQTNENNNNNNNSSSSSNPTKRQKGAIAAAAADTTATITKEQKNVDSMTQHPYHLHELAPKSEVLRFVDMHQDAMNDDRWYKMMKPSSSNNNNNNNNNNKSKQHTIGPDFLVGKPLRLYNPNENAYHNGRIINWRLAKSYKPPKSTTANNNDDDDDDDKNNNNTTPLVLFYGDGPISQCEFLVRFPAGMNGRKVTVHKWIVLEEHCVAITSTLVWAQRDKNKGILGWRPAQIFLRSSLELITMRKFLHDKTNWALVGFFGEENYAYVKVSESTVDFFSKSFHAYRNNAKTNLLASGKPNIIAQNDEIELACSLLMVEYEEQCRVSQWHKIPLKHKGHEKALTIHDESSLPPLSLPLHDDEEKNNHYNTENSSTDEKKKVEIQTPKLCPLFEQGLDRLWIASIVGDKIETSLDTLASFRFSKVDNRAAMMSQLKQERNSTHI